MEVNFIDAMTKKSKQENPPNYSRYLNAEGQKLKFLNIETSCKKNIFIVQVINSKYN